MLNFTNPCLLPKVVCKTPSTDDYGAENLISPNYTDKMRGFISYPSIKPPVEIEFNFICPVNMHYIVLNTTVGNQRCSGIELFAKTDETDYLSIGKCVYDNPGIVFCNSRKYSKTNPPPNIDGLFNLSFFKSNTFRCFLNATAVKICIFKTNKSVPCMSSVEVWGTPSRQCSKTTVNTVTKLASKNKTIPEKLATEEKFVIPEDFKDDLTFELMSMPMTLPSGKTVDQSTLEKHLQTEKSFGRKPCDPFTGVKFNENLKPVMNAGLKSRIDMFVLQNSHREGFLATNKWILGGDSIKPSAPKRLLDDDLDSAIAEAKRSKHFIDFTNSVNKCSSCETVINFLYRLPCEHFFCRDCLLKICETLKCSNCYRDFARNEIVKYNL
ncbi:unnamed protein product [Phyllotreta striolata]|uniref:RING-type domain-containing protein n=1 Tax=Phyllotreta striolata TaxID=444603 RepID=A0A9P0DRU8_PHYSR|nr:unnamed protein product [Phyllotreta striolata]